jgi:hypothetical protein
MSLLQTISDSLFGPRLDPSQRCAWCHKAIGQVSHAPLPVCRGCLLLAFQNCMPSSPRGNLWEKLMTEFRPEAERWARNMMRAESMDAKDARTSAQETLSELLSQQRKVFELMKAGRAEEAGALNNDIIERRNKLLGGMKELDEMMRTYEELLR